MRGELDHLTARLAALEAIVTHVTAPLLVATDPELARELLENIRSDFVLRAPSQREHIILIAEKYIARLGDEVEARVRAKVAAPR
jgi:hypothetical protein